MALNNASRRIRRTAMAGLLALVLSVLPMLHQRSLAENATVGTVPGSGWELRILHASDQEAGKKALLDIVGMVAVMDQLNQQPYANTLKLTSGDLFIAGPFLNASRFLYSNTQQYLGDPDAAMNPLALAPGLADIMINNKLGWQAAAIGNHEFDLTQVTADGLKDENFFEQIAARPDIRNYDGKGVGTDAGSYTVKGAGIGADGYPGARFPYLSVNLDFNSFKVRTGGQHKTIFDAYGLADHTAAPVAAAPNSLARSTIIAVGTSRVGVIGATTPFLPDIAGGLGREAMLPNSYAPISTPADRQAQILRELIAPEVDKLHQQGVNKIVLMTHLQDSAIEQELSQQLVDNGVDVDIVIGGGSHKLMGPADAQARQMLRGANQSSVVARKGDQIQPALVPYPETFINAKRSAKLYYVNSGSNYEYLNQLVVRFDEQGNLIDYDQANSRPWRTDGFGVSEMLHKPEWQKLSTTDQISAIKRYIQATSKSQDLRDAIDILAAVEAHINSLDQTQYGFTTKWLNGNRADIRSRETNLGNLVADAMLWYAQQVVKGGSVDGAIQSIDVAFVNGGGIRDSIGTEQLGADDKIHRAPPEANPLLGKQEGEVSRLDILNSLRFDNFLTIGTIPVEQLKRSIEAMIAKPNAGAFGQISGFSFAYRPGSETGGKPVVSEIWLTKPQLRRDGRIDGSTQQQQQVRLLYSEKNGFVTPGERLGLVTINYLAEGAEGQGQAQLTQNIQTPYWLGEVGDPAKWPPSTRPQRIRTAPPLLATNLAKRDLRFGSYRDALAAYLEVNHNSSSDNPFAVADPLADPAIRPTRIRLTAVSAPAVNVPAS